MQLSLKPFSFKLLTGPAAIGGSVTIGASLVLLTSLPGLAQSATRICLQPDSGLQLTYLPPFTGLVQTVLSNVDLRSPGDCLLTRDRQTGLEWLNITQTTRQSYDSITAGFGGYINQGFRIATRAEVEGLVANSLATLQGSDGVTRQRSLLPEAIGFTLAAFDQGPLYLGDAIFGSPNEANRVSQFFYQGSAIGNAESGFDLKVRVDLTEGAISRSSAGIYRGVMLVRGETLAPAPPDRATEAIPTPVLLPGVLGLAAALRRRIKRTQG
jgi:hypothetical protein